MAWWVWLVVALVLGIVEVATLTFVLLWISIAGLITAILSVFSGNVWFQVAVFVVVSAILIIVTRPIARKWKRKRTYPSRLETLLGAEGVVVHPAKPGAFATVRIQGELWSAESESPLESGQQVKVTRAVSTVLTVTAVADQATPERKEE